MSGGAEGAGGDQYPNDALTIHGRALALHADAFFLIYHHGRSMTRPDWYAEGVGHEVPLLNGKGQGRPIYRDAVNRTGIIGYQMQWQGHWPEAVERGRADYALWHESLCVLAADLDGLLEDFTPVAPARPAMRRDLSWGFGCGRVKACARDYRRAAPETEGSAQVYR